MATTDLQVILKAKDLAEHTLRITSNCKKLMFSMDRYVKELLKEREEK